MHFLIFFVQKSFLTKKYFHTAEINFTSQGPLYTCLVYIKILSIYTKTWDIISLFRVLLFVFGNGLSVLKANNFAMLFIFLLWKNRNFWLPCSPQDGVHSNEPCLWSGRVLPLNILGGLTSFSNILHQAGQHKGSWFFKNRFIREKRGNSSVGCE